MKLLTPFRAQNTTGLQKHIGVNNEYIQNKRIYQNALPIKSAIVRISLALHQHGQFEQFEGLRK